jgi:polyhydroxybutyrate depolymerase
MKLLRIILFVVAVLAAGLFGLYFYLTDSPAVAVPDLAGTFGSDAIATESGERSFSYYIPQDLPPDAALVLALHGSNRNGQRMREIGGYEFDVLADRDKFVVVYPDGYKSHWNDCRASADYAANQENIDDIAFLGQLVAFFANNAAIDPGRVYVTGFSNGGQMAYRLALEAPDLVTAIAPISANLPVDDNLGCKASGKPVSVAIFNGTRDPVNPYEGGLVEVWGNTSRGTVMSASATADYWNTVAGVTAEPEVINFAESDGDDSTSVLQQRWQGQHGTQIRLYTMVGSGHVIPSKIVKFPRAQGPGAGDISGPEEIIDFFLSIGADERDE